MKIAGVQMDVKIGEVSQNLDSIDFTAERNKERRSRPDHLPGMRINGLLF